MSNAHKAHFYELEGRSLVGLSECQKLDKMPQDSWDSFLECYHQALNVSSRDAFRKWVVKQKWPYETVLALLESNSLMVSQFLCASYKVLHRLCNAGGAINQVLFDDYEIQHKSDQEQLHLLIALWRCLDVCYRHAENEQQQQAIIGVLTDFFDVIERVKPADADQDIYLELMNKINLEALAELLVAEEAKGILHELSDLQPKVVLLAKAGPTLRK